MTDEQLIEALRRLDAPATPNPRFQEALRQRTFDLVTGTTKPSAPGHPWFMAAVAAVLVVAVIGAIAVRPDRGPSQSQPVAGPSASASVSPSPLNSDEAALAFDRPFRFRMPADAQLEVNRTFMPLLLELIDGPLADEQYGSNGNGSVAKAHGIEIASLRGTPNTHPCPNVPNGSSRVQVSDRQPAFLDDLEWLGGMSFASPAPATVGSRPAISTALSAKACDTADFHVANGFLDLNKPSRLILVDFDGPSLAIQIWATTEDELSAWLPTAQTIIDSIEFVQPSASPSAVESTVPSASRMVRDLRVPFEYRLPEGIESHHFGSMIEWVGQGALSPPDAAEPPYALNVTRGIVAANADTAWSHGNGRVRLRTDPAGLLEDIRGRTGLPLPAVETTVDGHPALTASSDAPGNNDLHFSERMEGLSGEDYIWFKFPMRLTLVDVDGTTMLFVAWARTPADLADWLPTADAFLASIHFLDQARATSSATDGS
jgi:hypothetical protein